MNRPDEERGVAPWVESNQSVIGGNLGDATKPVQAVPTK